MRIAGYSRCENVDAYLVKDPAEYPPHLEDVEG